MPFTLIKGTFHIEGYSPDGDSIRFMASDPNLWNELSGRSVKRNARGHAQLRVEAIDTLETHYNSEHQPMAFAKQATDALLAALNITDVVWNENGTRVESANDGTEGYILSRKTDNNGRPIAFLFAGATDEADGSSLFMAPALLQQSINYKQLADGLAYPTYYKGLFHDLRDAMTAATVQARNSNKGLWAVDKTSTGFEVTGLSSITDEHVILPKLFRRLVKYLENGGSVSGFKDYLAESPEPILVLESAHFTNFDSVVRVEGNTVKLTVPPEGMVFLS
ncbi:MAG: nuclease [Deltaproteobacteria bacterium]|nr:MAG: nuclease [Deltaproteobacteria bacterium]